MYKSTIVALAIAATVSWIAPAQAFPVMTAPVTTTQTEATQVDWHGHHGNHIWRRGGYSSDRYSGHRNGGYYGHSGYYGHRGYYGYRHGGNAGAIIGGLAAGAIIGGALASRPHYYGSHASYCASKYRSYRASDNTYQPNNGPRRQCR
jgi:hypothetical protein